MSRRRLRAFALAAGLLIGGSQIAHGASSAPPPGYKPLANTDEAGIWLQADDVEKDLQQSPLVIQDEALNAFMKKLVCDLAGPQCGSVRAYVIDSPYFNASCYPNGMFIVNTGLLLRMENEAQLAFVLGHELTHYTKRHTLNAMQSRRDTAGALTILSFALGGATTLAELVAVGALASYSRDQEREADVGGFQLAVGRGYDPRQGSLIWAQIEEEEAANPNRRKPWAFIADHPANKERLDTMRSRADEMQVQTHAADLGESAYRDAVTPLRSKWLEQEINRGEFNESIVLIQRMIKRDPGAGELQYYLGEAYRRRNGKGDPESAIAAYRAAISGMDAPAAVHRSLGLVALKSGQKTTARDAFRQYLELAPDAGDRATVEYYLKTAGE